MSRESKIHQRLVSCLLIGVGVGLVSLPPRGLHAEETQTAAAGNVVAKVNGKPIYEEQLTPGVESGLRIYRKYGGRANDPRLIARLQHKALDDVIAQELLTEQSRKLEIEDIDARVEERLSALKKRHKSEEQFARYLKMKNRTVEDVRRSLRERIYLDEYLEQQGISEPRIPEERIREAYDRNPSAYSRKESVEVSHILIAVDEDAGAAEREQAQERAEQVRKEVLSGRDFAEMARQHSDCNSAPGGGSLGHIKRGYMPASFDAVAFSMEEDAVSDVVKTHFGYHIIKVSDKKPGGVTPYEDVREFIERYLQQQESEARRAAHLAELKERATIEIFLEEPEAPPPSDSRPGARGTGARHRPPAPPPASR